MNLISKLLNKIKPLLGFSNKNAVNVARPAKPAEEPTNIGVNGRIDADIVVLRDHDRVIISIDYDFKDVLGWIEWDVHANKLDLVQKSGSVAELGSVIPANDVHDFANLNKVFVITRYNQEKIMHNLSLVIRN